MTLDLILNIIQTSATSVAALSVLIALGTYFYNKKKDKRIAAIDQITFFRKEIISTNNEFIKFVREKKGEDYIFSRVRLDNPTIKYTVENLLEESKKQIDLFSELNTLSEQTAILNMLEELSQRIAHFKTIDHSALDSIKLPFVEIVEIHAVVLLSQREVFTGIPTYSSILETYLKWITVVDRKSSEDRHREVLNRLGSKT